MSGPPHPGGSSQASQDNINRMISMYLPPGDAEAARAGDPQAQSRIQALYSQYHGSLMSGMAPSLAHGPPSHSPDPSMVLPPPSAYTV